MRNLILGGLLLLSVPAGLPELQDAPLHHVALDGPAAVEPAEDAPLGPAVDPRFGRTWKLQGLFGSGTAALVDYFCHEDGSWTLYFLSAEHVTDANGDEFLLINDILDLTLDNASATFVHPTEDAVLLSVAITAEEAVLALPTLMEIRWEPLNLGEEVLLDGFGAGSRWISEGRASTPRGVSIDLFFGDSGSPLQDADGKIVGIMVMRGPAPHHGWVVPMEAIREWLNGLSIK